MRNKTGEVITIARKGAQNTKLLQGQVDLVMRVLDGLMEFARLTERV